MRPGNDTCYSSAPLFCEKGVGIVKTAVLFLIRFYQTYLTGLKRSGCCRFSPTCSQYAFEAVSRYGTFKGLWLALLRLLRCNPLFPGGYDPLK